jgi:hypothetical protein
MKLNRRTRLVGGVLAAAVLALAPAAIAANVVKVGGLTTPVGPVSMIGISSGLNLDSAWAMTSCPGGATLAGSIQRGAVATAGAQIGSITSMTGSACTSNMKSVNISVKGAPWGIYVRVTPAAKTQQLIEVEVRILVDVRSTGAAPYVCHWEGAGTVRAQFDQVNQQLILNPTSAYPLAVTAYDGSGGNILPPGTGTCGLATVQTGDLAKFTGTFSIATPGTGGVKLN